ncbi:MAG: GAF domain-containing sensor histidine kinase [Candidatus Omnitrophica bacterium]|nr:GAF domain-containing sensor histidine kinase [Candidatus Omnitrophota bacterium]
MMTSSMFYKISTVKYRVLVPLLNVGIFFGVYVLVWGVPIGLYFSGYKMLALFLAIFLSMGAPFLYFYFQKRLEERILLDERTYQDILLKASRGLSRHKTEEAAAGFIIHLFLRIIGLRNVAVYLLDDRVFSLKGIEGEKDVFPEKIPVDSLIVGLLKRSGSAVLARHGNKEDVLTVRSCETDEFFRSCSAQLAVALMRDGVIVGIFILGKKINGMPFSDRDLSVLGVIADQTALAIENCRYLRAETERIKEEGSRVRREYLDTMVACMAHEIDNPMTVIIGQAGLLKEILSGSKTEISGHVFQEIDSSLGYMQDAAQRVSKIIKKVEEFAKGGAGKSELTNIYDVLEGYRVIKELSKKMKGDVSYEEHIAVDLPIVLAEKVMLEEVLINFMENAYHAVARNEGRKSVTLRIFSLDSVFVRLEFKDNGYGMSQETLQKVFEVPTTTKGSSEGTGLGLYRVRQICDVLGAHFGVHSDGLNKGACVWIDIRRAG